MLQRLLLGGGVGGEEGGQGNQEATHAELLEAEMRVQHAPGGGIIPGGHELGQAGRNVPHHRQPGFPVFQAGAVCEKNADKHQHQLLHLGGDLRRLHPAGVGPRLLQLGHQVLLQPHQQLQNYDHGNSPNGAQHVDLGQGTDDCAHLIREANSMPHVDQAQQISHLPHQNQHRAPGHEAADQGLGQEAHGVGGLAEAHSHQPTSADQRQ
mmetsp:Transcript_22197/g.52816  ORF Transcript_22197/g.52816 Transcript_22197/m.52816 type:complete len:209 (-) Transcript_22197:602-1228(-)